MFISKLQLKNFKRFSDLTIDLSQCSEPPKLVLLIGANGSGKSCIFDAFEYLEKGRRQFSNNQSPTYFRQESYYHKLFFNQIDESFLKEQIGIDFSNGLSIMGIGGGLGKSSFHLQNKKPNELFPAEYKEITSSSFKFYGRSAFRYTPRIAKTTIGVNADINQDLERPQTYIDIDTGRFEADIDKIFSDFLKEIKQKNDAQEKFNNNLNNAFTNIFGNTTTSLKYEDFDLPVDGKSVQFWFTKGFSKISYDLLSAGEKMVFELFLNLYARKDLYQDAIVFFDEIDLHLNTTIQYNLLKEITENWIPDNSQVWVASHSLGFIDYAREYNKGAIIDFDNLNFDDEQVLKPLKNNTLDIYEIAVPKNLVQKIFQNKYIVICENKNDQIFNSLLLDKKLFVGVPDRNAVFAEIKNNSNYIAVRDRDYLTDLEIERAKVKYRNLFFLKFYCLENYLYHPHNLQELNLQNFYVEKYISEIEKQKNEKKAQIKIHFLKDARKGDSILKIDNLEDKNYAQFIEQKLDSENFSDFYTFFSMKDHFNKQYLEKYQLGLEKLSSTQWFKAQIEEVLK